MARLVQLFLLLLSARALADDGCVADGTCQADETEASALLQSAASQKARATQHSDVNTTKTTTLTCYPNYAAPTCGASMNCFLDTTGCTTSGGGVCCKAAGNGAGLEQCKFCGDSTCGPCPGGPAPTPSPTPWPTPPPLTPAPTASCQGAYQTCGTWASTGQWYGYCCSGLVCIAPAGSVPGARNTCQYQAAPMGR